MLRQQQTTTTAHALMHARMHAAVTRHSAGACAHAQAAAGRRHMPKRGAGAASEVVVVEPRRCVTLCAGACGVFVKTDDGAGRVVASE